MDKVSNQDVFCHANLPGVEALITKAQLRWSGAWRQETQNGITAFEVKRLHDLDVKRSIRKERARNSSSGIACPVCGRTCASEFGLRSHLRRHWGRHGTAMFSNE